MPGRAKPTPGKFVSVSEDHLFDLLAILVFIVSPFGLASVGLWVAVRSRSWFWPVIGYVLAVGGTWVTFVATVYVAECPSQDGELCGDQAGLGADAKAQLLAILALAYVMVVIWRRLREPR
jgi:hypothetical protein